MSDTETLGRCEAGDVLSPEKADPLFSLRDEISERVLSGARGLFDAEHAPKLREGKSLLELAQTLRHLSYPEYLAVDSYLQREWRDRLNMDTSSVTGVLTDPRCAACVDRVRIMVQQFRCDDQKRYKEAVDLLRAVCSHSKNIANPLMNPAFGPIAFRADIPCELYFGRRRIDGDLLDVDPIRIFPDGSGVRVEVEGRFTKVLQDTPTIIGRQLRIKRLFGIELNEHFTRNPIDCEPDIPVEDELCSRAGFMITVHDHDLFIGDRGCTNPVRVVQDRNIVAYDPGARTELGTYGASMTGVQSDAAADTL